MSLSSAKVLTFDVVGTLIDFETGIVNYIQPIADKAGLSLDPETILASYGKAEGIEHEKNPGQSFPGQMAAFYAGMAADIGLPDTREYREGFRLSIPNWPAFPDSVEALKGLREKYRLVAMTNSDNWAYDCFAKTLDHPFDNKVTAEDVESCKPDPQVFAFTRGLLSPHGYRMADYLHVAQSQYHDIGVAKSLGYETCWIERRKNAKGYGASPKPVERIIPDHHFGSLKELLEAASQR